MWILVNFSASPSARGTLDVMVPYEASTAAALHAITQALKEQEDLLADPYPRALVEGLETNGVRIRAYFWWPMQGVDGLKRLSDVRMKVKVALQQAGIAPPPMGLMISLVGRVPVEVFQADGRPVPEAVLRPDAVVTAEQAKANLRLDQRVAEHLTAVPAEGEKTVVEHVLSEEEHHLSEEGRNLLTEPEPANSDAAPAA
jgi:hypothetical protein